MLPDSRPLTFTFRELQCLKSDSSLRPSYDTWRERAPAMSISVSVKAWDRYRETEWQCLIWLDQLCNERKTGMDGKRCVHTDSLSDTEDRGVLLFWRMLLPGSETWLVTVERRVDIKLLLVKRSPWRTHSSAPRHGIYLAKADLTQHGRVEEKEWRGRKRETRAYIVDKHTYMTQIFSLRPRKIAVWDEAYHECNTAKWIQM